MMRRPKLMIASLAIVGLIGGGASMGNEFFEISKNLEIFSELYKQINMYYADETKPGALMKTGVDAMLGSLDPYTNYIPESKMEDYRFMTTGQYGGIGSLIRTMDGEIYISEPYEDFPAHEAGLKAGDHILKVDGIDISDKSQKEVSEVLKGSPGSSVKIRVSREGEGEMDVMVKRAEIKIPDVPYSGMLDDKTGYIKLTSFTSTASKEVREAYKALEQEGMEQVILDLRGNGGGLLREAINIVNFFVPRGTEVVSTKGKIEEWDRVHKALNEPLSEDIPVAVLIDGGSASASEIVSGTLQDLDRAIVVGQESFGKGLVQQTKDIPYGSKLKLTVAKYYTPSGRCIQRLDHFDKNQGKAEEVPDSLIREFKTANGRPVFDGKGISPDVEVEPEMMGKVMAGLFKGNHFFKYATDYARTHSEEVDPSSFTLSEAEFQAFLTYVEGQDIEYSTDTEDELDELIAAAKDEKYYEEAAAQLEQLKQSLKPELRSDALKYQDQIKAILESEIISRYAFQNGRMIHSLKDDPVIETAIGNLAPSERTRILGG